MGQPSLSIYVNELLQEYGVTTLIRIGSCGAIQKELGLRSLVIAMAASTDSAMNQERFRGMTFAPTADAELFSTAYGMAKERKLPLFAGNILATDTFYTDDPESWRRWAEFGVLALEMESAALYTLAAKYHARALSLLTVSDSLITGTALSAEERQSSFSDMAELALDLACGIR
jgi:purine-nucleoside phosphorylase